jgi:hypothetical protein
MGTQLGIGLGIVVFLMSGCSTLQPIETPDLDKFPKREYRLQVGGTPDAVRRDLSEEFSRMLVPFRFWKEEETGYLVSTLVNEPGSPGWLRETRSSVLVTLKQDKVYPYCSDLSLRWLVESKGSFSDLWKPQSHNREYTPYITETVRDYASSNVCQPR